MPITLFGSATADAAGVTMPASVAANDIAIFVDCAFDGDGTPPSTVTPSGFALIGSSVSSNLPSDGLSVRANISRKVLAGSEGGSTITGMTGTNSSNKAILVFRPTVGTWGTVSSVNAVAQDSDPGDQTVTVGAAPGLVIAWASIDGAVTDLTMYPSADGTVSMGSPTLIVGYIIYNAGAANNTVSTSIPRGAFGSFWYPLIVPPSSKLSPAARLTYLRR